MGKYRPESSPRIEVLDEILAENFRVVTVWVVATKFHAEAGVQNAPGITDQVDQAQVWKAAEKKIQREIEKEIVVVRLIDRWMDGSDRIAQLTFP